MNEDLMKRMNEEAVLGRGIVRGLLFMAAHWWVVLLLVAAVTIGWFALDALWSMQWLPATVEG